MNTSSIRWVRAVTGTVMAEVAVIAAAFACVAFYSHVVNPGQPVADYQAWAGQVAPWVSVIAGIPVFYALGRWWAKGLATALAIFGLYLLVDGAILFATGLGGLSPWIVLLSYFTKFAASCAGGRSGRTRAD